VQLDWTRQKPEIIVGSAGILPVSHIQIKYATKITKRLSFNLNFAPIFGENESVVKIQPIHFTIVIEKCPSVVMPF
jgi:hypothetical protein